MGLLANGHGVNGVDATQVEDPTELRGEFDLTQHVENSGFPQVMYSPSGFFSITGSDGNPGEEFPFIMYQPGAGLALTSTGLPDGVWLNEYNLSTVNNQNLLVKQINWLMSRSFTLTKLEKGKFVSYVFLRLANRYFGGELQMLPNIHNYLMGITDPQMQNIKIRLMAEISTLLFAAYGLINEAYFKLATEKTVVSPEEIALLLKQAEIEWFSQYRAVEANKQFLGRRLIQELLAQGVKGDDLKQGTLDRIKDEDNRWAILPLGEALKLPRVHEERLVLIGRSPLGLIDAKKSRDAILLVAPNIQAIGTVHGAFGIDLAGDVFFYPEGDCKCTIDTDAEQGTNKYTISRPGIDEKVHLSIKVNPDNIEIELIKPTTPEP